MKGSGSIKCQANMLNWNGGISGIVLSWRNICKAERHTNFKCYSYSLSLPKSLVLISVLLVGSKMVRGKEEALWHLRGILKAQRHFYVALLY